MFVIHEFTNLMSYKKGRKSKTLILTEKLV